MTVFKPVAKLAVRAARTAVAVARGEKVAGTTTLPNGFKDVPCLYEEIVSVDQSNMMATVVAAGFHPADKLK